MGTYTKLRIWATLRQDTPVEVIDLLNRVINDRDLGLPEGTVLFHHEDIFTPSIDHPFFKCERWEMLLLSTNFDETLNGGKFYKCGRLWVLHLDTEFLNRNGEINHFINWLSPYVNLGRKKKKYIGWSKHENQEQEHYWVKQEILTNK
jgi:hypothetical protein